MSGAEYEQRDCASGDQRFVGESDREFPPVRREVARQCDEHNQGRERHRRLSRTIEALPDALVPEQESQQAAHCKTIEAAIECVVRPEP